MYDIISILLLLCFTPLEIKVTVQVPEIKVVVFLIRQTLFNFQIFTIFTKFVFYQIFCCKNRLTVSFHKNL